MIIVCTFILFFSNRCNLLQEVLEYDATLKGFQQQKKSKHTYVCSFVLCCQAYAVDPIIFLWARALMQEICDVMYTTPLTSNISS